jgi:hypothetical protein
MNGLVKRADYCQFLLASQVNYTLTYFADHARGFSHDAATRYLSGDRLRPSELWRQVKGDLALSPNGCLIFDDSVLDKNHSREIEGVYLFTLKILSVLDPLVLADFQGETIQWQ